MHVGKQDQLKPIDANLWATCMYETESAPALCPVVFANTVNRVLSETLGMSVDDITHTNCRSVFFILHVILNS